MEEDVWGGQGDENVSEIKNDLCKEIYICTLDVSPSSDFEMHYSEEATFYSTAVSNVCTALCALPSENRLLTLMHLTI